MFDLQQTKFGMSCANHSADYFLQNFCENPKGKNSEDPIETFPEFVHCT